MYVPLVVMFIPTTREVPPTMAFYENGRTQDSYAKHFEELQISTIVFCTSDVKCITWLRLCGKKGVHGTLRAEKRTAPFWAVAQRVVLIWDNLSVPSPRLKDPSLSQIITTCCITTQKFASTSGQKHEVTQPGCCRTAGERNTCVRSVLGASL